jgi:hypothetical protein
MRWLKVLAVVGGMVLFVLLAFLFVARSKLSHLSDTDRIAATLEADLAVAEARDWPRPPLFDEPADGTGWDHYLLAIDPILNAGQELSKADLDQARKALTGFDDPDREIPNSLKDLLADAESGWLEVRRGGCTTSAGRVLTPRTAFEGDFEKKDHPCNFANYLSDVARARAALLAPDDPDGAIETLMVLHRFGEDFAGGGPAINWIQGLIIQGQAMEMMGRLVTGDFLTHERADHVLAWLDRVPTFTRDPLQVADCEVLAELRSIQMVAERELQPAPPDRSAMVNKVTRESHYRALAYYRAAWSDARASTSDQGVAALGEEYRRLLLARRSTLAAALDTFTDKLVGLYYDMTSVVFEKMDEIIRKYRAKQSAVALSIHAHRIKEKEGRYPSLLEELVEFAGRDFPCIEEIVYRELPDCGDPVFYFEPDLEWEEITGKPAKPLARVCSD